MVIMLRIFCYDEKKKKIAHRITPQQINFVFNIVMTAPFTTLQVYPFFSALGNVILRNLQGCGTAQGRPHTQNKAKHDTNSLGTPGLQEGSK